MNEDGTICYRTEGVPNGRMVSGRGLAKSERRPEDFDSYEDQLYTAAIQGGWLRTEEHRPDGVEVPEVDIVLHVTPPRVGHPSSIQPVRELKAGLWHWQAPHPEWTPEQRWPREVSSCAIDDSERLCLFDPLAVPDPLLALAREREPVIVLTAPWHERDARALVERLGATVFAPPPDTAQDLIDKYGITPEQASEGSPDLRWLGDGDGAVHWYGSGDRLPVGIDAYAGREHNDLVLWIEDFRAVVAADSLADFGGGLALNEWLRGGVTRQRVLERLRPLLGLPVEVVLPAHGAATDRAALERALR